MTKLTCKFRGTTSCISYLPNTHGSSRLTALCSTAPDPPVCPKPFQTWESQTVSWSHHSLWGGELHGLEITSGSNTDETLSRSTIIPEGDTLMFLWSVLLLLAGFKTRCKHKQTPTVFHLQNNQRLSTQESSSQFTLCMITHMAGMTFWKMPFQYTQYT